MPWFACPGFNFFAPIWGQAWVYLTIHYYSTCPGMNDMWIMHGRILSPSGSCQGNWKLRENRILVLGLLGRGSRKLGRENKRRKGDNRRKINTNIAWTPEYPEYPEYPDSACWGVLGFWGRRKIRNMPNFRNLPNFRRWPKRITKKN